MPPANPSAQQISILIPLAVATVAILCTIVIHALAVGATLTFIRRERHLGHAGASFWGNAGIVMVVVSFAFTAHLAEIALWAVLLMLCGEFPESAGAFGHSAGNYTTLGYGTAVMTPSWRLLGPLEAVNGTLMFGVSTAMIFSIMLRLVRERLVEFRDDRA